MASAHKAPALVIFRDSPDADEDAAPILPADYALERLRAEQEAARNATSEAAHSIHSQLARAYAEIARQQRG